MAASKQAARILPGPSEERELLGIKEESSGIWQSKRKTLPFGRLGRRRREQGHYFLSQVGEGLAGSLDAVQLRGRWPPVAIEG